MQSRSMQFPKGSTLRLAQAAMCLAVTAAGPGSSPGGQADILGFWAG